MEVQGVHNTKQNYCQRKFTVPKNTVGLLDNCRKHSHQFDETKKINEVTRRTRKNSQKPPFPQKKKQLLKNVLKNSVERKSSVSRIVSKTRKVALSAQEFSCSC